MYPNVPSMFQMFRLSDHDLVLNHGGDWGSPTKWETFIHGDVHTKLGVKIVILSTKYLEIKRFYKVIYWKC